MIQITCAPHLIILYSKKTFLVSWHHIKIFQMIDSNKKALRKRRPLTRQFIAKSHNDKESCKKNFLDPDGDADYVTI